MSVPDGTIMWIDLEDNKVSFTTGRITLSWTWKVDDSIDDRYYINISFDSTSWETNCPSWMEVLNNVNTIPTNYQWNTQKLVSSSGFFYCGK